jgi:hypothetical protein
MSISPVTLSWLAKHKEDNENFYEDIIRFREYDEGTQPEFLTEFEKALIGGTKTAQLNICPTINETEVDRLEVQSIVIKADENPGLSETLTKENQQWWKKSRMDAGQRTVHYNAARDGDSYLIVEYNTDLKQPIYSPQIAFDGESGTEVVYLDGDVIEPIYAFKVWTSSWSDENNARVQRLNYYLKDRVLKLVSKFSGEGSTPSYNWQPYTKGTDGELEVITINLFGKEITAGVEWWTDDFTENGIPLGIPVFHFRHNSNGNAYGRSNLADIVPTLQDSINISSQSYTIAARLDGTGKHYVLGSSSDSAITIKMVAGAIIAMPEQVTSAGSFPPANLEQLGAVLDRYLRYAGMLTRTPISMLNPSGQVAAEGTLQQQEIGVLAKVKANQVVYGNSYEDAARMAIKLAKVVTDVSGKPLHPDIAALPLEAIKDMSFDTIWQNAKTRNEREEVDIASVKVEKLGVPLAQVQREQGYDESDVEDFAKAKQTEDNVMVAKVIAALNVEPATDDTDTTESRTPVEPDKQQFTSTGVT